MKNIEHYAFVFGCAYAEACGKDPGEDYALLGQADNAGLEAVIAAVLEDAAAKCDEASDLHDNGEVWINAAEYCASEIRDMKK